MSYNPSPPYPPPATGPPPGPPPPAWGPPPAPGWGPPPQQGAPKSNGNAGIWILLLVLVVGGVGAFVLLSGDEERSGPGGGGAADDASSPEEAVTAYFDALNGRDCTTMTNLTSSATWSASGETLEAAVAECEAQVAAGTEEIPTVSIETTEVVSEAGDSATVSVTATTDGASETNEILLVKEDGQWKIDFYNMGASASMDAESSSP